MVFKDWLMWTLSTVLLKGTEAEWTEPVGSEGGEHPQPRVRQRQEGQGQQCGKNCVGTHYN